MKPVPNEVNIRQRVRSRIEEVRERFGTQTSGQVLRDGKILGGGKVLDNMRRRFERTTGRIKQRKPGVLPALSESIRKWQAGQRIREILPGEQSGSLRQDQGSEDSGSRAIKLRT